MGVLQQLFFPTPMPKLSKTKAPVPEVKTALTDWSQMKMDLENSGMIGVLHGVEYKSMMII